MTELDRMTCDDCGNAIELHRGGYGTLLVRCGCDTDERMRSVKVSSRTPEVWS